MKFRNVAALILFSCCVAGLMAQEPRTCKLEFQPVFGEAILHLPGVNYSLFGTDSIQVEKLRFYASGIKLLEDDRVVWSEENSFHLLDASENKSLSLLLKINSPVKFNHVTFSLGIDSLTNVSGALGDDLDPTRGMYWTWQSGYINFKLEGKSNLCKTRNSEFHFHLGGYVSPDATIQTISLPVQQSENIKVLMNLKNFFSSVDLSQENEIMTPGQNAMRLSKLLPKLFSVPQQ